MWEIFMWAQNNLWASVGIFVGGLMNLRPENLYLNRVHKGMERNEIEWL